jgi:hypothetical protein
MKTGISIAMLPVLLLAGCCNMYKNRVNQQLWERELRLEENCIYQLRWQLEDKQRELDAANARTDSLNRQSDILKDQTTSGPNFSPPPAISGPAGGGGRATEAPRLPPAPKLPDIDIGQPFVPGSSAPPSNPPTGSGSSLNKQPDLHGPALTQASYTTVGPESGRPNERTSERLNPDVDVDRIILNAGLTGEVNTSGKPGAGVLNIVIEQRDAQGSRVLAPGDISIVVVDPAIEGNAGRIARWNFAADQIAQYVRRNHDGGSLRFELHWPTAPEHSDLRLFVRFTTFDGRRLEANLPIEAQVADAESAQHRWTKSMASLAAHLDDALAAMPDPNSTKESKANRPEADHSDIQRSVYEASADEPAAADSGSAESEASNAGDNKPADDEPKSTDGNPYTHSHRPTWSPNRPRPE